MMNVVLVGGGSSAHALVPLLSKHGHTVSVLTRRPMEWQRQIDLLVADKDDVVQHCISGKLSLATQLPEQVIPQAEIIILCLPVHQYRTALNWIAPFIRNDSMVFVGTMYGQAGFNWMFKEISDKFNLTKINYFAIGLLPWMARTVKYGHSVKSWLGPQKRNLVATSTPGCYQYLSETILEDLAGKLFLDGYFVKASDFISISLSVDNQIIHPSRCYAIYKQNPNGWHDEKEVPYFYKDYDDESSKILEKIDNEYIQIKNGIKNKFTNHKFEHLLGYMELEDFTYGEIYHDIKESFIHSTTLANIRTPVYFNGKVFEIDFNHRFFVDDIGYGLCVARWFAEQFNIETPMIDEIIHWVSKIKGEIFIKNNKIIYDPNRIGTPETYGLFLGESVT